MAEKSSDYCNGVIDAHVHISTPFRLAGLMRWVRKFAPDHPVPEDVNEQYILHDMKSLGARYFFNLVYPLRRRETRKLNLFNYELTRRLPNSAGWGSVHPRNELKEEIIRESIEEYDFVGLKFHPFIQKFSITDRKMSPVYETMNELKRPVIFHTGFDEFYEMKLTPDQVAGLAADYPDMKIVIAHMLAPDFKAALDLMAAHENIIGDLTLVPGTIRYMLGSKNGAKLADTDAAKMLASELPAFADRLVYGSDHPAGLGSYNDIFNDFYEMGLPPELEKKITWHNPMNMVKRYCPGRWE